MRVTIRTVNIFEILPTLEKILLSLANVKNGIGFFWKKLLWILSLGTFQFLTFSDCNLALLKQPQLRKGPLVHILAYIYSFLQNIVSKTHQSKTKFLSYIYQ